MTLVDLTLIMAAVNSRAPMHRAARDWWEKQLNSEDKNRAELACYSRVHPPHHQFEDHAGTASPGRCGCDGGFVARAAECDDCTGD
jgi:hypothetical protein